MGSAAGLSTTLAGADLSMINFELAPLEQAKATKTVNKTPTRIYLKLSMSEATPVSYLVWGENRFAVWGPWWNWGFDSDWVWLVLIGLSLSFPADAFSLAYS